MDVEKKHKSKSKQSINQLINEKVFKKDNMRLFNQFLFF